MSVMFLCLILSVVPLTYCATTDQALLNVFGTAPNYAGQAVQAVPVVPQNGTLLDLDYWDTAHIDYDYTPGTADYDKFDWILTKRVGATSEENFLLSPLGLKLALAILTEAATGTTQTELNSVLGFEADRNLMRRKFSTILQSLHSKTPQYILNIGSRIYLDDSVEPRQRYAAIAQEFYKTDLSKVDFNNGTIAAKEINGWVANITSGRIPNLVNEDDVSGLIIMILNTLYFKGTWRYQFPVNATYDANFYVTPKTQKKVPFMTVRENFYYAESSKYDSKILRMPYVGNKFSMYLIVPNSLTGLPKVMAGLGDLRNEMVYLQQYSVDVTIPKFHFEGSTILNDFLKEMGIRQAFEDTASFPGIARGQQLHNRLHISKVLQRCGIEVNEAGSVAYAATEISLVNKYGEDTVQEVVANKPFLFFIQDDATRQLLFTGRVSDPSQFVGKVLTMPKI